MKTFTSAKQIDGEHPILIAWSGWNQKGRGRVVNNGQSTVVYMNEPYPVNDDFAVDFAEWCIKQNWDKTSASLGVDKTGNNIAKSTKELMKEYFKITHVGNNGIVDDVLNLPQPDLSEDDLVELGFEKRLMIGTGTWRNPDEQFYYKKGRITINATKFWTWFLDGEQRNDIAVSTKDALRELLQNYR